MHITHDKWDKRFIELAKHISEWSKDPSTKVGAVITDGSNRIISLGFNGFPQNVEDNPDHLANRELKLDLTIHAEMNAILFANQDLTNCTLYTYPLPPCIRCAVHVIQSGIKRVVSIQNDNSKWKESCDRAAQVMKDAGIDVVFLKKG